MTTKEPEAFTLTLSRAKRDDLIHMLNALYSIVDRNSNGSYGEIIAKKITQRRISALLDIVNPERKSPL